MYRKADVLVMYEKKLNSETMKQGILLPLSCVQIVYKRDSPWRIERSISKLALSSFVLS